ncbi:MAG: 50S ribosomal protein L23 [Candidatus Woesebacteria bacterium GW2011_GWB1_41_10]|uniref:50S ribosomal protein L23 n=1 Tax=Candidatus Woesebacteria bacterium GW2011_GWB1_41_10 TaxID=1618577 RepID=A0A0G0WNZ6_9BACT|nr:MAG: 50S ribosomal protein L23 [Candidatus Woesebacteria bacterium GW2011_GWB1_41_10]
MLKPVSTEKATNLAKSGKYMFWVDKKAKKPQIKSKVAKTYKVNVISVKTLIVKGKKKAVVSLKEGQKIEYEKPKKNS